MAIAYPPFINILAILIGKFRDISNAEMAEVVPHFRREGHGSVDILGAKGELIAQYAAFMQGKPYTTAPMLAPTPVGAPDIIIGDKRFDVKAVRESAPELMVNADAHNKAKEITDYWFVQPYDINLARFWFFKYDEVSDWPQKKSKYSGVYYLATKDAKKETEK